MRLFYTTDDFIYKGHSSPCVPFLCEDNMEFVVDVNDYLLWISLENSHTSSPATWKCHAESLYDYFSWLRANNLEWNSKPQKRKGDEEITNVAVYRNWSLSLINPETGLPKIQRSTVRKRLTHLMSFYRWAQLRQRIDFLPWDSDFRIVEVPHPSMYRHTRAGRIVARDNLRPKAIRKAIPLLTISQCKDLLNACSTKTLLLMTKLMLQTGLRNEECRTFPRKYIFDPIRLPNRNRIPLNLDPSEMALKGNKPRRIYVTWQLMKELFDYLNFGDGAERSNLNREIYKEKTARTFLNNDGEYWSEKGLNNAYRKLWVRDNKNAPELPFRVTPHMLRHTFATFELYAESKRTNLGNALAWVRDRLGHRSIATTTIYVHCLDLMEESELNFYQKELDEIIGGR
jgi:integrase